MPGIIYHLAFAEEVSRHMKKVVDKRDFYSGNLIPDLVVPANKKSSHYTVSGSVSGFGVPDMEVVKKELYDVHNPIKLGMYCHLYLDFHFINNFLIPEFIWDTEGNKVINPRNGLEWTIDEFWAPALEGGIMYKGYTQINGLMLKNGHISQETLDILPDNLPLTGMAIFDNRREMTWREELNIYLNEYEPYTGEILNYDRLSNTISSIAEKFVAEEL